MPTIEPGSPERTGFYINAALYGPANMVVGPNGKRRYQSMFEDGSDDPVIPEAFKAELAGIGKNFTQRVISRFREKHDRTGKTAASFGQNLVPKWGGNKDITVYTVRIGGGVGFVINPLPTHMIPQQSKQYLEHDMTSGSAQSWGRRMTNWYHNFSALGPVEWKQGGDESYSPDKSWYEDDPYLPMEAFRALASMAARVELIWGEQSYGNFVSLTRPQSNSILFPTSME